MPRPLLLTGGSVVDVRTGSVAVRPILLRDDRIVATGEWPSTAGAERVDVSGAALVLLDVDSTADVANLHRIAGVVRAGTYRSRADPEVTRRRLAAGRRAA